MKQKTKHYRCTDCRKLVTFAVVNNNQNTRPTICPQCHTRLDEHDEVVQMVRTRYHPRFPTC